MHMVFRYVLAFEGTNLRTNNDFLNRVRISPREP